MDDTLNKHIVVVLKDLNLLKKSNEDVYFLLDYFKSGGSLAEEQIETLISDLGKLKMGIFKGDEEIVNSIINELEKQLKSKGRKE